MKIPVQFPHEFTLHFVWRTVYFASNYNGYDSFDYAIIISVHRAHVTTLMNVLNVSQPKF